MEYQDQASGGQTSEINAPSLVKYATLPGSGRCRGPRCEGKVGYLDATQQEGDSQAPRRSNAVGSAMLSILFCSGLVCWTATSSRFASLCLPSPVWCCRVCSRSCRCSHSCSLTRQEQKKLH